jgi:hypothetical protein
VAIKEKKKTSLMRKKERSNTPKKSFKKPLHNSTMGAGSKCTNHVYDRTESFDCHVKVQRKSMILK